MGLPVASERQTVGQFLTHWLEAVARPKLRPRTYLSYEHVIRLHLAPGLGHIPLRRLTPQALQAWINEHAARTSPRRCHAVRAILRAALNQAVAWGLVARNVAGGKLVTVPRATRRSIQPLDPDQARAFVEAISGHRLEALFTVAIALGLRLGEALGLRWVDVDLKADCLHVRQALQRVGGDSVRRRRLWEEHRALKTVLGLAEDDQEKARLKGEMRRVWTAMRAPDVRTTLTATEPKTERSRRSIALPAVVRTALEAHRKRQLEARMLAGQDWQDSGFVFTTGRGTPLDGRGVHHAFKALLKKADLPTIRFHDLRHTAATLLLSQGVSPRTIMETLGHSQISLTLDTYSHVMPTLKQDAAIKMHDVLTSKRA
jgi:integrase